MTTILHIEDDSLWAGFVADHLRSWPEFKPLGTAGTGAEGVRRSRRLAPDIVVLDLRLPSLKGLEAIDQPVALPHPPRVLLSRPALTMP